MDKDDTKLLLHLKKQKKRAEKNGDIRGQAEACRNIGEIYSRNEEYDDAIEEYKEELWLFETLNNQLAIALATRNLGETYAKKQSFDNAVPLHKRYLSIARECDNKIEEQRALATLGSTYFGQLETEDTCKGKMKTYQLARDCFMKGLEVTEELKTTLQEVDYMDMKGRLFQNLGLLYDEMNQPETSSNYFHRALAINSKFSLLENLFMCQSSLTSVYQRHGDLAEAKKYAEICLETARKMKVKENEALALMSMAMPVKVITYEWKPDPLLDVQLNEGEFQTSRHLLKKAFKVGTPSQKDACKRSYRSGLIFVWSITPKAFQVTDKALWVSCLLITSVIPEILQNAKTIHKATEILIGETDNMNTKMKCFDTMGDAAADLGLYKLAIHYYNNMLETSRENASSNQDTAKIHISLAMTYKDDKQLIKAIEHYKEEIKCYSEEQNDQICKSWMNVGAIQELLFESYVEAKDSYVKAFNAAKHSKTGKLQVVALENLIALLKNHDKPDLLKKSEEKLAHIQTKYKLNGGLMAEDTQSEELDDRISEDNVSEMSDLTESEDEEIPENTMNTARVCRKSRKIKVCDIGQSWSSCLASMNDIYLKTGSPRRNLKGETPLHVACIDGKLEDVRKLISQGHPVNVQDYGGWTPLHEASNYGYLEIVKLLIESGADVNNRGGNTCDGITPLMDAAGNGMIDCVELMLRQGANILAKDDKNRTVLDHLTDYLHRSLDELDESVKAQFNNLVQKLRDKIPFHTARIKANKCQTEALILEEDSGRSSRPVGRRKRSRNDIINNDSSDSNDGGSNTRMDLYWSWVPGLPRKLYWPVRVISWDELKVKVFCKADNAINSKVRSPSLVLDEDSQVYDDLAHMQPFQDLNGHNDATAAYKNAMASVGRSAQQTNSIWKKSPKKSVEKTALIMEDEYVQDDWLIEDVSPVAKRRKMTVDAYKLTSGLKSDNENVSSHSTVRPVRKRHHSAVISDSDNDSVTQITLHNTHEQTDTGHSEDVELNSDSHTEQELLESELNAITRNSAIMSNSVRNKIKHQTKLTDFRPSVISSICLNKETDCKNKETENLTIDSNSSIGGQTARSVMRIKVQIKDKLLLVPVIDYPGTKTVAGFIEDVCERYSKLYSLRPVLTLGTRDGARFSPDDLVSLILSDGEKIEGFLDGWQIPSMPEQYRTSCKMLNTVFYKNIEGRLITCEQLSGILDLANLSLKLPRLRPIIEAIKHQNCLIQLELKGNRLGDEGVDMLSKVYKMLPNLAYLGLACNNITNKGLRTISDAVTFDKETTLKNLCRLDISHNPLKDLSQQHLLTIIQSVPSLNKLSLASCNITSVFFKNERPVIAQVLNESSLQHIDISYNNLEDVGIYLLLRCLNPMKIASMNLTATLSKFSKGFWEYLSSYLAQDGCVLQILEMCHIPASVKVDICDDMKRFIESATSLQSLNLSSSKSLDNSMMQCIMKELCKQTSVLEHLILKNCGISSPLSLEFIDSFRDQLAMPCPLRELQFTCAELNDVDADSLTSIWNEKWLESADVKIEGNSIKLSVKNSL